MVIFEHKNFLILNKPAGVLVHGILNKDDKSKFGLEPTVVDAILASYPEIREVGDNPTERPGIVHRLDKDTSGVLVVARNQKFYEYLKFLFQTHEVKKTYLALVWGKLSGSGIIDRPIGLKSGSVKRSVHNKNTKMIKEAVTEYQSLKIFQYDAPHSIAREAPHFTLVRVIPKTGRTHQIRVHLASIGHPVVGDKLYGKKNVPFKIERQFLHAESIEFSLEDGQRIKVAADLPEDLKTVILELEKNG